MEVFRSSPVCRYLQRYGGIRVLKRMISNKPPTMAAETGTSESKVTSDSKESRSESEKVENSRKVSAGTGTPTGRDQSNVSERGPLASDTQRFSTSSSDASATRAGDGGQFSASSTSGGMASFARAVRGGPVTWASLVLLVITGAGLLYYFDREKRRRLEAMRHGTAEVSLGPSVGKAAIGGPFKLVNQDGKTVTDEDLKGNWNLIYFGFTHCPDICPEELQKMVQAIDTVEKKLGLKVVPVFISVDPARDGVEQIREYVKEIHPKMIGLTGSADAIMQVARAYRVYYMKTDEDGADYLVDHSIVMYLMDPNMEFVKFFGKNNDADQLASGIIEEVKSKEVERDS